MQYFYLFLSIFESLEWNEMPKIIKVKTNENKRIEELHARNSLLYKKLKNK